MCFLQSSEDLRKEIASLEFEILRTEQYLLSLYRTAFDEQVSSFSPHTETSLVSNQFLPKSEQSDVTSVFSYHYQASPASECSSLCPPRSFQASLKALSARVSNPHLHFPRTNLVMNLTRIIQCICRRRVDMFLVVTLLLEIFWVLLLS